MKQEDKELLLKDLCARLLYGVKVNYYGTILTLDRGLPSDDELENGVKPYLRPISSMTKEELNTYARLVGNVSYSLSLEKIVNYKKVDMDDFTFLSNWLNKRMLDYRGLIPMGLALEAPEGMYK